jgi:hypothetical protein
MEILIKPVKRQPKGSPLSMRVSMRTSDIRSHWFYWLGSMIRQVLLNLDGRVDFESLETPYAYRLTVRKREESK